MLQNIYCQCNKINGVSANKSETEELNKGDSIYNYIVKLDIKPECFLLRKHSITAAFIDSDLLITACFNFLREERVKNIKIISSDTITLTNKDYTFISLRSKTYSTDMCLIKIKDTNKLKQIYKGHFKTGLYNQLSENKTVNLTGYSGSKPDKLINRKTFKNKLYINECENLIAYNFCICSKEKGMPLWANINGEAVIIGIHHGEESDFFPENWNSATLFTQEAIRLINTAKK